jgi:Calcineurin-like phosphoesterase
MTARCLTAMSLMLLFCVAAHAQAGFPPLSPVPQTGNLNPDPSTVQFTFIAAGDNRPSGGQVTQPQILSKILNDAKRFKPAFAIWSGDTIGGFRTAGQPINTTLLTRQYQKFFEVAAEAGMPIFNSPGNHEMDNVAKSKHETVETPDPGMVQLYLQMMQYPAGAPAYGAFNYGNSRFIAVDTEEPAPPLTLRSPGKKVKNLKLDPGFVTPRQIDLLGQDLEANQGKAHIFVFMHHPIKPAKPGSQLNLESAEKLEALFAQYKNVSYVIAAHEHIYFNATGATLNPTPPATGPGYLVSGGAGAPLDSCPTPQTANCLAAYHYLVFQVNGSDVTVQVVVVPVGLKKKSKSK